MKFYNLIFNQATGEAGFLPKGWSTIAMQRCSSAWSPFLLPTPLSPPSFPSSLTWMRREQHEGKQKKRLICFFTGAAVLLCCPFCLPSPSFPLSSSHLSYTPQLVVLFFIIFLDLIFFSFSRCFELPSRSLAENSYTFGFVQECECPCRAFFARASFHLWDKLFLNVTTVQ